MSDTTTKGDG
ncbi:mucin-associated surface protein (MASP), putative, partial [Trypanosoma cruzi marinkellei]